MDRYQLEHLADHLHAAGRIRDLQQLISRDWMAYKRVQLGSHRSLAHDVELVIHSGDPTRMDELPLLFKHCLLSVTLSALTTNVPPEVLQAMASGGEVEQALAYVDLIVEPFRQAHALLLVTAVLVEEGDLAAADPLWSQAEALIGDIDRQAEQAAVLCALASQLAQADRQKRARHFVREVRERFGPRVEIKVSFSEERLRVVDALTDLALAQAILEEGDAAHQTLSQAFTRLVRGYDAYRAHNWMESLRKLVNAMARAGDQKGLGRVESALARHQVGAMSTIGTQDGLRLYNRRPFALAVMAVALAEAGKIEQARRILGAAREASRFRGGVARYAAEGAAEMALATVIIELGIPSVRPRSSPQGKEPRWNFRSSLFGPLPAARQALSEADAALRRVTQEEAARAQERTSSGSRLMQGVEGLARLASRVRVPGALLAAEHLKDEASYDENFQRIERMDNQLTRAACLAKMAAGWALLGEQQQAGRLFAQALEVSETLEDEERQAMALRQIALCMRRAGGIRGLAGSVAQAAERFRFEPRRIDLHAGFAIALAQAGRPEAASRAIADALVAARGTSAQDFAMSLAPRLVPVGHRQGLRLLVAEVEKESDREERATAYAMLAGSLARVGESDLAQELVRYVQGTLLSLEGAVEIPLRLALIADAQAELGQHRQSRRSLRRALGLIETLTGKGLVGGVLQRVLGDEEDEGDSAGDEDAVWELAIFFLMRPAVRVGDEATFSRLLDAARAIRDVVERADVLQGVVMYVAEGGVEGLLPPDQLGELLNELAWLIPAPGELAPTPAMQEMTRRALREAVDATATLALDEKADTLAQLGLAQGVMGDRAGLGKTLAMIAALSPGEQRSRALGTLAPALARIGDRQGVAHACASVETVSDPQLRADLRVSCVDALNTLTVAAVRSGDVTEVARTVDRALKMAQGEAISRDLVGALANMAGDLLGTPFEAPGRRLLEVAGEVAYAMEEVEPGALALVARVHALSGRGHTACQQLNRGAVLACRVAGGTMFGDGTREAILDYLELAIPALVALDGTGGLLEQVWRGVRDIDTWWLGRRE